MWLFYFSWVAFRILIPLLHFDSPTTKLVYFKLLPIYNIYIYILQSLLINIHFAKIISFRPEFLKKKGWKIILVATK